MRPFTRSLSDGYGSAFPADLCARPGASPPVWQFNPISEQAFF